MIDWLLLGSIIFCIISLLIIRNTSEYKSSRLGTACRYILHGAFYFSLGIAIGRVVLLLDAIGL